MNEIISLLILFVTIAIFYFVMKDLITWGVKKMTGKDIKPFIKQYCTPVFIICWVGSIVYVALFNFPGLNTGGSYKVKTAKTPYGVTSAPIVTNTVENKITEVSKEAKGDADNALDEACSIFNTK